MHLSLPCGVHVSPVGLQHKKDAENGRKKAPQIMKNRLSGDPKDDPGAARGRNLLWDLPLATGVVDFFRLLGYLLETF